VRNNNSILFKRQQLLNQYRQEDDINDKSSDKIGIGGVKLPNISNNYENSNQQFAVVTLPKHALKKVEHQELI
jgi:hypothetical protein